MVQPDNGRHHKKIKNYRMSEKIGTFHFHRSYKMGNARRRR
jgi:hypothetical protein